MVTKGDSSGLDCSSHRVGVPKDSLLVIRPLSRALLVETLNPRPLKAVYQSKHVENSQP